MCRFKKNKLEINNTIIYLNLFLKILIQIMYHYSDKCYLLVSIINIEG